MKKIRIGIPRSLLYYREGILLKNFFYLIGGKVIISPETNKNILKLGITNTIDSKCIAYKIYIGHVLYLKDYCDYILIASACDYGNKNRVCQKISNLSVDIGNLIPRNQILNYNIHHTNHKYEFIELFKLGFKVCKNPIRIIYSYILAKEKQKKYDLNKEQEEKNKLSKIVSKVLIMGNFYNLQEKYLITDIKEYLSKNNILLIYTNNLDKQIASTFSEYYPKRINFKYQKEMIGALYYYQNQVDGIIILTDNNCEISTEIYNTLKEIKIKKPTTYLDINENNKIETYLEALKDIIILKNK